MIEAALSAKFEHNQKSPLLKLPAELRTQVYRHVFNGYIFGTDPDIMTDSKPQVQVYNENEYLSGRAFPYLQLLSLGKTCRQLHHETYLLPFECIELRIEADLYYKDEIFAVQSFLDGLSEERRAAITKISVPDELYRDYAWTYRSPGVVLAWENISQASILTGVDTKPLRSLLDSLAGLKCILVSGEVLPNSRASEKVNADVLQDAEQECGRVGEWIKSMAKGEEIEVMIEGKLQPEAPA